MSGISRPKAIVISEETLNQVTHGFGLLLSIAGAFLLITTAQARGDEWQFTGCCLYAASLVALYTASTLSHSFSEHRPRQFFRMLDQVCIFLLIGGTFTPFALSHFRHGWMWILSLAMWSLTCVGILFKLCFRRGTNVPTLAFVLLACIPVIGTSEFVYWLPIGCLALIVAGGGLYMMGVYFLTHDYKSPYHHAVWHLLVVFGSVCHYCAVMFYLLPAA